jgi:hypothetical protein
MSSDEALAEGDGDERASADLLARAAGADPSVAADVVFPPDRKAALLVALVQAGADRKLLDLAERLNYAPACPHRLLERAILKLRGSP